MGPKETRSPFECNEGCTADRRLFDLYAVIKSDKRSSQVSRQSGRRWRWRGSMRARARSRGWAGILACSRHESSCPQPGKPTPTYSTLRRAGAKNSQGHMLCGTTLSHPSSSSDTSCIIHIKIQTDIKMNNKCSQHKTKQKKAGGPLLSTWSLNRCENVSALFL